MKTALATLAFSFIFYSYLCCKLKGKGLSNVCGRSSFAVLLLGYLVIPILAFLPLFVNSKYRNHKCSTIIITAFPVGCKLVVMSISVYILRDVSVMLLPPLAGTVYRLSIISWLFSIPCNWLV
jgi:hypothetical protein